MPTFGLIGYPLSHSFSQGYFTEKFAELGLSDTHRYLNFSMETVDGFAKIREEHPDLLGCNVTIPHKEAIIPLLDELDPAAASIGAVNTILFSEGKTIGFNTDYVGFKTDLLDKMGQPPEEEHALVLGTGGASLAIHEALRSMRVGTVAVSRRPGPHRITYADITPAVMATHRIIVNTTPLGMYPAVDTYPDLPYEFMSEHHFCYDLVYNPDPSKFLQLAQGAGAGAASGLGMLYGQAEASWEIWRRQS